MRNSARKQTHNHSIKSRLKSLEKNFLGIVAEGKKQDAAISLRHVSSALDKAAKAGVIHRATANRKKSRLTVRINALK